MRACTLLVALWAAVASAQSFSSNSSNELDMKLDPKTLQGGKPAIWCRAQTETCNTLCDNNTQDNMCDKETFKYECTCASNKSAPCLQYYKQTLPTLICEENFSRCNKDNVGDADKQMACITDIQDRCGKQDPPKLNSDSGSSSGSSSSSNSDDSSFSASIETFKPTSAQKSGGSAVTSSTSGGLAAPTMVPAGNGAAAAAAAIGFLACFV